MRSEVRSNGLTRLAHPFLDWVRVSRPSWHQAHLIRETVMHSPTEVTLTRRDPDAAQVANETRSTWPIYSREETKQPKRQELEEHFSLQLANKIANCST